MTELSRKKVLADLDQILNRTEATRHREDAFGIAGKARYTQAITMRSAIEAGDYDIPGAAGRDFYIEMLRVRWSLLTPRQIKKLYRIDSTIKISVQHLATDDLRIVEDEPEDDTLSTPKRKRGPWFWPVVSLSAFAAIILGGTILAIIFPA